MKTMTPKPPATAKPDVKAAKKAAPAAGAGSPRQNMGAAPAAPKMGRRVAPTMGSSMGKAPPKPDTPKRSAP